MKRVYGIIGLLIISFVIKSQTIPEKLSRATMRLLADSQMKHAVMGLLVVKGNNNEKIFEVNAQIGLVPASCQKIITGATAFELLGSQYQYQTILGYEGTIEKDILKGNLLVIGSGDPSLGSWRFESTKENIVFQSWMESLKQSGIQKIEGDLIGYTSKWETENVPGGWIWDDIGNYYGAGVSALNWHENQYDLILQSGKFIGDPVKILGMKPKPFQVQLESQLTSASKESGDNAYIYLPPYAGLGFVRGTIPIAENSYTISGSFPNPPIQIIASFYDKLVESDRMPTGFTVNSTRELIRYHKLYTWYSPPFDSLNYWFMKKSINLYGEAFLKTMAYEKTGLGSTVKGIQVVKKFWQERGIESSALKMIDGSGLSPQNRVTPESLVTVLQYAKSRPWFNQYYEAFPVYNQMKLKSGTIGGAKSFAGYHTAKDGTAYTIAFIINNYDGSAGEIVKKMYLILDVLK